MILEPGLYWISEGNAHPEVACWADDEWWIVGSEEPVAAQLVEILSERLELAPRRAALAGLAMRFDGVG